MDSNFFTELGGGLTIVSLLGVLVQNFLKRRKEDSNVEEKVVCLRNQLEKIDHQQGELLLLHTANAHKLELLLQKLHGENQLLSQRQQDLRELAQQRFRLER
jgi:heme exporter protein D